MATPATVNGANIQAGPALPVVILNQTLPGQVAGLSSPNTPSIITSAGIALNPNATRKSWAIQNLGTNALFVRFGSEGLASTTVFHRILKGASGADDGSGGLIEDDTWGGQVSVAGTSPRFVVTEFI